MKLIKSKSPHLFDNFIFFENNDERNSFLNSMKNVGFEVATECVIDISKIKPRRYFIKEKENGK